MERPLQPSEIGHAVLRYFELQKRLNAINKDLEMIGSLASHWNNPNWIRKDDYELPDRDLGEFLGMINEARKLTKELEKSKDDVVIGWLRKL